MKKLRMQNKELQQEIALPILVHLIYKRRPTELIQDLKLENKHSKKEFIGMLKKLEVFSKDEDEEKIVEAVEEFIKDVYCVIFDTHISVF
ncbi:MAG: hypothetical protein ACE5F2_01095 [Candidatus Paceibacteria bacterium]